MSVHAFEILTTEHTEDHGAPREFFMVEHQTLTERIIRLAIEVYRAAASGPPVRSRFIRTNTRRPCNRSPSR